MDKAQILQTLVDQLAPVFKARYDFVNTIDADFYRSAVGQAELLNMALISQKAKNFSDESVLKKLHDDYFSTMFFHSDKEDFLAPIRQAGWNIDFNQHDFRKLIHHFAQDAGVDAFYNAVDLKPNQYAPINFRGEIKNWDEMKHSSILFSEIPHYWKNRQSHKPQQIDELKLADFCNNQRALQEKTSKQLSPVILAMTGHVR
ncbi:MAG: hypothetical protein IJS26_03530 [Alphaproteobacteria bacterium]|nr:hypothetical protein [Alphaproteobacteria bacterium]